MPSGGKRKGAGRPERWIEVGSACEFENQSADQRRAWAKLDAETPLEIGQEREKILTAQLRFVNPKPPSVLTPNAVKRLDEIGRTRSALVGPKMGQRQAVLKRVATRYKISPETADKHWKRWRELLRRLEKESRK
jgi:hypothetical protein